MEKFSRLKKFLYICLHIRWLRVDFYFFVQVNDSDGCASDPTDIGDPWEQSLHLLGCPCPLRSSIICFRHSQRCGMSACEDVLSVFPNAHRYRGKRRNDQRRGGDVVFSLFAISSNGQQSHRMSGRASFVPLLVTFALFLLNVADRLFVCLKQPARVCGGPSRWETHHVTETSCMLSVSRQSLSKARRRSYSAHAQGVACN